MQAAESMVELPTEGSLLYTYMLSLPVGHLFEFDFMDDAAKSDDGLVLQFTITKKAADGWEGLPFGQPLSSTADVVEYCKECTCDEYMSIAHGKDPRRVKKEIAYG